MKPSIYNSIIRISDNCSLIFNAMTCKFIPLRHASSINATELINCDNEDLRTSLKNAGILVEDDKDEVQALQRLIKEVDENPNEFILHINPTLDCNFSCWYCYENHSAHSKMSEETIKATQKFISKVTDKGIKRFNLGFFGGEPLFHFHYIAKPLIEYAADICKKRGIEFDIHFTSNGALLNDGIIEFLSHYHCGLQITLDGDKEVHDKTRFFKNGAGSYERITRNILKLVNSGISVIARLNYTSQNIEKSAQVLDFFKELDDSKKRLIQFDFQRVWQEKSEEEDETERKAQNIRTTFREEGFTVLTNYIPHSVSESCYGDKINHVLINYDGLVFGCTARDFTEANSIGRITRDGTITYNEPIATMRRTAKFSNPICHSCRIAPICGGGCKQRALEALGSKGCPMGYSEYVKDNKILNIFEYRYSTNGHSRI